MLQDSTKVDTSSSAEPDVRQKKGAIGVNALRYRLCEPASCNTGGSEITNTDTSYKRVVQQLYLRSTLFKLGEREPVRTVRYVV